MSNDSSSAYTRAIIGERRAVELTTRTRETTRRKISKKHGKKKGAGRAKSVGMEMRVRVGGNKTNQKKEKENRDLDHL